MIENKERKLNLSYLGIAILTINYLQIKVSLLNKQLMYLLGLSPRKMWVKRNLNLDGYTKSAIVVKGKFHPQTGIGYELKYDDQLWVTYYDEHKNLFCIGDFLYKGLNYEFVNDTIITLDHEGHIHAIWLRPNKINISPSTKKSRSKMF